MIIKQISVFIENAAGRLFDVCNILGENAINIRAISISDTADFGILRMVVNDPNKSFAVLTEHGFTVKITDVLGVEVADSPGGLVEILLLFKQYGINIEYLYTTLERNQENAVIIFKVNNLAKGLDLLKKHNINNTFKIS